MKENNAKIDLTIGEHSKITGDLNSRGSIRVDGEINGNIHSNGMIIVGEKGHVKGDLTGEEAIIAGNVEGNLTFKNYVELNASAKIKGDINAELLQIDKGAVFNGKCVMGSDPNKKSNKK